MSDFEDDFLPEEGGGQLGPYVAQVVDSRFVNDEKYNNGESLLLRWTVIPAPGQHVKKQHDLSFTVGKNFETLDGGITATHISGKPHRPHKMSRMGRLMHRAFWTPDAAMDPPSYRLEGDDHETVMTNGFGLIPHFMDKGVSSLNATGWEDLVFTFGKEVVDYGGEIGEVTSTMPIMYHGTTNAIPDDWPWKDTLPESEEGDTPRPAAPNQSDPPAAQKAAVLRLIRGHQFNSDNLVEEAVELAQAYLDENGVEADAPIRRYVNQNLAEEAGLTEPF